MFDVSGAIDCGVNGQSIKYMTSSGAEQSWMAFTKIKEEDSTETVSF